MALPIIIPICSVFPVHARNTAPISHRKRNLKLNHSGLSFWRNMREILFLNPENNIIWGLVLFCFRPGIDFIKPPFLLPFAIYKRILTVSHSFGPWNKSSKFLFPTNCVIPKSLGVPLVKLRIIQTSSLFLLGKNQFNKNHFGRKISTAPTTLLDFKGFTQFCLLKNTTLPATSSSCVLLAARQLFWMIWPHTRFFLEMARWVDLGYGSTSPPHLGFQSPVRMTL